MLDKLDNYVLPGKKSPAEEQPHRYGGVLEKKQAEALRDFFKLLLEGQTRGEASKTEATGRRRQPDNGGRTVRRWARH